MTIKAVVILSEQSELRDLGIITTAHVVIMRRYLDFVRNDISLHCFALTILLTKTDNHIFFINDLMVVGGGRQHPTIPLGGNPNADLNKIQQ